MGGRPLHSFVVETTYAHLPAAVQRMAERCLLDLAGTAMAGAGTPLSRIVRNHAVRAFSAGAGAPSARILFDGRSASPLGAALAGGMTIDSFDSHDGHVLTKGHAGCAILPALLALTDTTPSDLSGAEFLASLVVGYEVAIRAGIAQHALASDYHASGAWNALGVAAVAARLWNLDAAQLRQALGIAEYHGPRSQMMRCIDFPTMVKDASGWGAMTGLSAAYLAADGFTGAPALLAESDAVDALWSDLGDRWRILEIYFKPYPICRWAQPAVEASLELKHKHSVDAHAIERVEIETFHNAVRLDRHRAKTTEEAQYSLPFPVAAAIVRGALAPGDVSGPTLDDPDVLAMSDRIRLIEAADIEARFPAQRYARARFIMKDGSVLQGETTPARGDAEHPLTDAEIGDKFHSVADPIVGATMAAVLEDAVARLHSESSKDDLLDLLLSPFDAPPIESAVA